METSQPFNPDDHEWFSIRIHSVEDDIEQSFQQFCEDNSIDRYLMCYEEDAARPHYHSMVECSLEKKRKIIKQKLFKKHFPNLSGNKCYAWTQAYGPQRMFQYICKDGNYRTRSIHFTDDILKEFHQDYWLEQSESAKKLATKKQKDKKVRLDLAEKWINKIRDIKYKHPSDFDIPFRDFIIENNIFHLQGNLIDRYYGLFLKTLDPIRHEEFLLYLIKTRRESYNC